MTEIHRRSNDRAAPTPTAGLSSPKAPALPSALVDEHARIVRARSAAQRVLARGRTRRRVLPPLVVGSGALLGSTAIGAWVFGQAPAATATAPTDVTIPSTTTPQNLFDAQLGLDVAALGRVRQALAADEAAISGLTASGTGSGPPLQTAVASPRSAPTTPAGTGSAPAATTSPTLAPLPALPGVGSTAVTPLAPLRTVPTVTAPTTPPPTHTTTGATVAVP